jgi:hypothetical protein
VRDRIVIGINNLELQKRLLAEDNLDLPRAEAQCRLSEITDAQFKNMNQSETIVIDAVQKGRRDRDSNDRGGKEHDRSGKEYDCKRCGTRHVFRNCPSFKKKCGNCNRLGHITELCRARKNVDTVLNENIDIEDSDEDFLHVIQADGHDDDIEVIVGRHGDSVAAIAKMNKHSPAADWTEHVTINGKDIQLKLDTGAQCNVMPLYLCESMNLTIEECPTKSLISYSEHRIPVIGQVTTNCIVRGAPISLTFKIVAEKFQPILGRASCESTKLISRVQQIKDDIFSGLGCLKGFEY